MEAQLKRVSKLEKDQQRRCLLPSGRSGRALGRIDGIQWQHGWQYVEKIMKPERLMLKVYGGQCDGQWSLINLDFSLAAQADTLDEARAMLNAQIKEYLHDALVGEDRAYAKDLLCRRAPIKYWLKYYFWTLVESISSSIRSRRKAFVEPMPMIPA